MKRWETTIFLEMLEQRLRQPLPGERAQWLMAPTSRTAPALYLPPAGNPRMSSVLIMLFLENGRWKFPLIQRPANTGVHSGQMALPGGRMEKRDRSRAETALRETFEEIGVKASGIRIIGTLTELHVQASHHTVLPMVGYHSGAPDFHTDPAEVDSLHIADLEALRDPANASVTRIPISDKISIEAPYYHVDNRVVWGATAMMLSEFLYIVGEMNGNSSPLPE